MKNASFHPYLIGIILTTLAISVFPTPASAMETPRSEDSLNMEHHAAYLRKILEEHKLHPCHFCLPLESELENVKIFDIKKHQEQRTLEIHGSHPKKAAFEHTHPTPLLQTPPAYFSLWNYLPSISMPRLWPFSWSAPTLQSDSGQSLTLLETSLLSSSQATSTPETSMASEELKPSDPSQSSPLTVSSFFLIPTDENHGRRLNESDTLELASIPG